MEGALQGEVGQGGRGTSGWGGGGGGRQKNLGRGGEAWGGEVPQVGVGGESVTALPGQT